MANVPPNIMKMILTYRQSQSRLIDIIAKAELKGNVTAYRKAVLQDVNQELGALNDYAKKWMRNEVPIAYGAGADEAFKAYVEANINPVKIYTNKKAIDGIINSATGQLTDASQYVGRRINDLLKEAGSEAISEKLSSGDTVRQAKALMLKKMSDKGITAIKDKRGREIALDAYASMVARTTTREATNIGTLNAVQEVGGDLVQITSHNSPCPICSVYEGRIYSISGNDKRYPPLDAAFSSGYSTLHPNCIHSVTPYFEQFDDEAEENRKKSNLPFEVDPKRKSELDAYYEDQKAKARKRADYRMWEKAKMLAPDDAPKTFSGFRSMKRADSERYQQLRMKMERPPQVVINENMQEVLTKYTSGGYIDICDYSQYLEDPSGLRYSGDVEFYKNKLLPSIPEKTMKDTVELMGLIKNQNPSKTTLYRIENRYREYKKGEELRWGIKSFSRDESFIDRALDMSDEGFIFDGRSIFGKDITIYKTKGMHKSLDVSKFSKYNQSESLVVGRYKIVDVERITYQKPVIQNFDEAIKMGKYEEFISKKGNLTYREISTGKTYTPQRMKGEKFVKGEIADMDKYYEEERNFLNKTIVTIEEVTP